VRRGAWLALLSLWLLTLAPTLARLQVAMDPLAWVSVCTSRGPLQGQTSADGRSLPNPAEQVRGGDSLFLALQGAMPALPAAAPAPPVPVLAADALAPVVGTVEHATPRWAGVQARAPPAA
jgi:hypothetical protein